MRLSVRSARWRSAWGSACQSRVSGTRWGGSGGAGGTEWARWCRMMNLLGGLGPGVRRSNPPASAAPVRRLSAVTTKVHNAQLQVQSVCVFWKTLNKNVAALQDRGHVLLVSAQRRRRFTPRRGSGSTTEEIYEWFAANLHRVREPSLRHYVRAKELKAAGMDWTEVLAAEAENPRARLAAELLASTAYDSTAARVKAFVEQGGGCRATFFNYRRRLQGGGGHTRLCVGFGRRASGRKA